MKPYDYYEIKTPWYGNEPQEPVAKNPKDKKYLTAEELDEFNKAYLAYVEHHKQWVKDRDNYRSEEQRLQKEFMEDVLEDVGLSNHAKKRDIYNYVCSEHKGERKEVIHSVLSELCDLFI